jgi:hypothetical protein
MHALSLFLSFLFNDIGGGGGGESVILVPSFMIAVLLPNSAVLVAGLSSEHRNQRFFFIGISCLGSYYLTWMH